MSKLFDDVIASALVMKKKPDLFGLTQSEIDAVNKETRERAIVTYVQEQMLKGNIYLTYGDVLKNLFGDSSEKEYEEKKLGIKHDSK